MLMVWMVLGAMFVIALIASGVLWASFEVSATARRNETDKEG